MAAHRTLRLNPTASALESVGPGELIGDEREYEVVAVLQTGPDANVYAARALNLLACPTCGVAVSAGTFCPTCAGRIADAEPLHCRIVERLPGAHVYEAEQRIKAAQEHALHPALPHVYDVFEYNGRAYLVVSLAEQRSPAPGQQWLTVVQWGQHLAEALGWLHTAGVALNSSTLDMLAVRANNVQLAHFGAPTLFTQGAQSRVIADDIRGLASILAQLGADTPIAALRDVLNKATSGHFASAKAFAAALNLIEPVVRRAAHVIVQSGALCDQGRARASNEDSLGLWEATRHHESERRHRGVYVVSDGMGGHEGGEIASKLTVSSFIEHIVQRTGLLRSDEAIDWAAQAEEAAVMSNATVFKIRRQKQSDMGATLVAAIVDGDLLTVVHLGDSRAYCWDGTQLQPITQDHSLIARLVAAGQVTPDEAPLHPQRSVLLQSVGDKANVKPSVEQHQLLSGQRILLCSDGLHGMIEDNAIAAIMAQRLSPFACCQALIDAANDAGGDDNISAVVVDYGALEA